MDNPSRRRIQRFLPPTIDGVAQAVKNYASVMHKNHCHVTVVTPRYRDVVDNYPFEVFRYQSVPLDKNIGYRAGNPFDPATLLRLRRKRFDLIHVHAPFASSVLVRNFNRKPKVPVIFTYHTKFDIEIPTRVKLKGRSTWHAALYGKISTAPTRSGPFPRAAASRCAGWGIKGVIW